MEQLKLDKDSWFNTIIIIEVPFKNLGCLIKYYVIPCGAK